MPRKRTDRKGQIGDYWITQRPNSPVWCRTWFDSHTRQTRRASLGTDNFRQAELKLAEWVTKYQHLSDERPEDMPLETTLVRYFEKQAKASASETQVKISLRFWSEHFAGKVISELTPESIEAFIEWLQQKGHSNGYINRTLAAGRAALNRAVKRQEVRAAPFIPALEPGEPRDIRLNVDEVAALFDACKEPHILMFLMLAFNTLSRPVALLELRKSQIDFENRLIELNPSGRKQTKKFRPTVPITDTLLPWLEEAEEGPLVAYWGRSIKSVRKGFNAMRDEAGLSKQVSPYAIRHTMAIELRKRGVPPWEVQGILGHKSGGYRTTEIYAKYDPDYLSKSAEAIDDYMKEILKRVKRPLNPSRLKELRLSCVRVTDKSSSLEKTKPPGFPEDFDGGAEGNRTPDLYNAIVALSQLSYGPIIWVVFLQATDTYGRRRFKAREK
jgi:integrase